jgi:hypothetical protein
VPLEASVIAGLAVGAPGAQFGRLRVRVSIPTVDAAVTELFVAVLASPPGLEAEAARDPAVAAQFLVEARAAYRAPPS